MSPKPSRRTVARTESLAEELAEETADDIPSITALQDDEQAAEELAELSVQLPEGASLSLYRMLDGAEKEYCDQMAVADFSVGRVAERFGGGRYTIYLRKPDPERAGKWIRQGSKRFRVAGAPRTGTDVAIATGATPGSGDADKVMRTYGDLIQQNVKASLENQQMLQSMQLAVLKSMAERPPDTTMELLKVVLPLMLGGKKNELTVSDVIALADRMANKTSPTAQLKETLDLVAQARELGGGEAAAPAWLGVARSAVEVIGRAMTYNPRQVPPADAVVVENPAPTGDAVPLVESDDMHPLVRFLAPQIPGLVQHAEQDHDPDTYAGVLADQISPQHAPDVITFLSSPTFMVQLTAAFPAVVPWSVWFAELRDDVIDRLQERVNPAPPAEPAP